MKYNEIDIELDAPNEIEIEEETTGYVELETENPDEIEISEILVSGDKNYVYNQNVPSAMWEIKHNLNKLPSVSIIDSANNEVVGETIYIDKNNIKLRFAGGFTGKATLN